LVSRSVSRPTSAAASACQAAALRNLSFLRNLPITHPYLQQELSATEQALQRENEALLESFDKLGNRKVVPQGFFDPIRIVFMDPKVLGRLLLGSSLFMWQNATGINAINYYS